LIPCRSTDGTGIIVDLFAGGGGASTGIEAALASVGRKVDLAINHSATALAVHKANHPETEHLEADIWEVRPKEAVRGRPVDVLWASPDCTHFSVAKGGKPRKKKIRSLAKAVTMWARAVRPRVIFLENVSEFKGWGPLGKDGKPDKARMGESFKRWAAKFEKLGYEVDYRVLDASRFGAPTRRKRLFLVARCDGEPILWPTPTHGPGLLPFHTAAECIDWSLPCPTIFACTCKHPVRGFGNLVSCSQCGGRLKALADKTLWRIAQGLRKFVLKNPKPFIVRYNGGLWRGQGVDQPLTTLDTLNRFGLVSPVVAGVGGRAGQSEATPGDAPIGTITAKNDRVVLAPHLVKVNHGGADPRGEALDEPLSTVTATQRGHALVAPTLIQTGYGERPDTWHCDDCGFVYDRATLPTCGCSRCGSEADPVLRPGQRPRYLDLHEPLGTIMGGGQKHAAVAAFLSKAYNERSGGFCGGQQLELPVPTVTTKDHNNLATATLLKLNGECHGSDPNEPMPTVTAGGFHVAEVRAFLTAYYGSDGEGDKGQSVLEPMRTITAKARLGLVLVEGTEYQIVDIGMRMLEPEELKVAQFGRFASDYDLSAAPTKAAKVRLIGNSVCPENAEAVVYVNTDFLRRDRIERAA